MSNYEEMYRNTRGFISQRAIELRETERILIRAAKQVTKLATTVQILVIILGAIVAAKAGIDHLINPSSPLSVGLYTFIGILIAALTGLESAFKWQKRAAELRALTSKCRTAYRDVDYQIKTILQNGTTEKRLNTSINYLHSLDRTLDEIQEGAANLGINLEIHLHEEHNASLIY